MKGAGRGCWEGVLHSLFQMFVILWVPSPSVLSATYRRLCRQHRPCTWWCHVRQCNPDVMCCNVMCCAAAAAALRVQGSAAVRGAEVAQRLRAERAEMAEREAALQLRPEDELMTPEDLLVSAMPCCALLCCAVPPTCSMTW